MKIKFNTMDELLKMLETTILLTFDDLRINIHIHDILKQSIIKNFLLLVKSQSINSLTAKSGYDAEKLFISDKYKDHLEKYFKIKIYEMKQIHGKKYDIIVTFIDKTVKKIQIKKIEHLGGRGDSFDRRPLGKTFMNHSIQDYLKMLSIDKHINEQQKIEFVDICKKNQEVIIEYLRKTLIGERPENNDSWCVMKMNKKFEEISIYHIENEKLFDYICKTINIQVKKTCLHLSKHIYLQRKGGAKKDRSPNDIQAKIIITQEILDLCDKIL